MIPKVIHYCWFGRNPLPALAVKCIESWKKYLPDYEIKEWNEDNFEILDLYQPLSFYKEDGSLNLKTVVSYTTEVLCTHGLKNTNEVQNVADIWIYPKEYFCPMDYATGKIELTPHTKSIHHFTASWLPKWQHRNLRIYHFFKMDRNNKWIELLRKIRKYIILCLK